MLKTAEDFKHMAGDGSIVFASLKEKPATLEASMEWIENFSFGEGKSCHGLRLRTSEEVIVTVLACETGGVFICPGGDDHCINDHLVKTKQQQKVWLRKGIYDASRYRVEFSADQFVYRIQEKNCLIPYPHGCLIRGFGWHDNYVYTFSRKSNIEGSQL